MSPASSDQAPHATAPSIGTDPIDRIVQAVERVPGVAGLHGGALGELATYLPGRRVRGIRVDDTGCEVHVILEWEAPPIETADKIRASLLGLVEPPIHVTIADILPPPAA